MKRAAKVVIFTVGISLIVAGKLGWDLSKYPDLPAGGDKQAQVVVEKGISLREIGRRLHERGIINHPSWFTFYGNERGIAQKVKAGRYTFASSMTPRQVLDKLVEGVPLEETAVTLPEGKNLLQLGEILEEAGISSKSEIVKLARDPKFVHELGVPGDSLEGWLFPDTYRFRPGTPASRVLSAMVKHGKEVLIEIKAKHKDGVAALQKNMKWGDREIVLMASLVEKETAQPDERPRIAGVFFNRLTMKTFVPHLLQTDPTIIYGCTVPLQKSEACKRFDGRIRRIHLDDRDNLYNTYTHEGLPPGPISNPGRAALEAVLAPDKTPYLYFVSRNDGTHQFSKTRAEHEAAVDKYQKHHGT
jgi:UPF0755 protein